MRKKSQIIREAAKLNLTCAGYYARDRFGIPCEPRYTDAESFCMLGALIKVCPDFSAGPMDGSGIYKLIRQVTVIHVTNWSDSASPAKRREALLMAAELAEAEGD